MHPSCGKQQQQPTSVLPPQNTNLYDCLRSQHSGRFPFSFRTHLKLRNTNAYSLNLFFRLLSVVRTFVCPIWTQMKLVIDREMRRVHRR